MHLLYLFYRYIKSWPETHHSNIVLEKAHSLNISVFEAVKVLHFSQRVTNDRFGYANFLMKKFGCDGTRQPILNQAWLNWVDEDF